MSYHFAREHSAPKPADTFGSKLCYQKFTGFCASRQHKNFQHGCPIKTTNVDPDDIMNKVDDANLKKELRSYQHFLVDSKLERARHKVFIYAIENLNAKILDEKRDHFSNNLKCVAKVILAFGFILRNIEDGGIRCFLAHENNTLLDRSKLVCTRDDMIKLKVFLNKTDVIESCIRGRLNTKWRFYKLTNLTVFAALLKDVLMGCKDAVLAKHLLENHTINRLTFEENTRQPYNDNPCLFRAFALHLIGNQDWKTELFLTSSLVEGMDWAPINTRVSMWKHSNCWRSVFTQYSSLWYRHCRGEQYRWTRSAECAKTQEYCQTVEIQSSYMLREQH